MRKIIETLPCKDSGVVHPSLSAYFGYCLYKVAIRQRTAINLALEKFGVIAPQLGIMCLLEKEGSLSQVDVGQILSVDKATMVKLIDGLEAVGWIKRESQSVDRRVKKISLTKKGEKLLKEILVVRAQVEKEFLGVLTREEEKQLRTIIPKLLGKTSL